VAIVTSISQPGKQILIDGRVWEVTPADAGSLPPSGVRSRGGGRVSVTWKALDSWRPAPVRGVCESGVPPAR